MFLKISFKYVTVILLLVLGLGPEQLIDVCHPISYCWCLFILLMLGSFFCHLPQPSFPFPTLFPSILYSTWNLWPQPLNLFPNIDVGAVQLCHLCLPSILYLFELVFIKILKPPTLKPLRAFLKFQIPGPVAYLLN